MRARGKGEKNGKQGEENETKFKLEDDLDALFKLPLGEFTVARNALAARLKKAGRGGEAERVKALVKPSISAWAVNQLYWRHRDAFDRLIAAGERFRRAHASQLAGKAADTRVPLTARREALSGLSRLAGALLRDAGYKTAPETMRRITTTLEALSTYSSFSDAPPPGRLTDDVDPPGFESLAALIPSIGRAERPDQSTRVIPFQPSASAAASSLPEADDDVSNREERRQTRVASAKAALQAAELALRETRTLAQGVAANLRKVTAHANETEKDRREAEERFEKASVAAEGARQRLQSVSAEAEKAARALEDAERDVEKARQEVLHSEK
ncbi:MAG: hypothetical protein DMG13_33370 [Acidobacteria bacterium]|nr:MAG: hypothetical protein DMG13_33370 [Acidobacteriota bacterium]